MDAPQEEEVTINLERLVHPYIVLIYGPESRALRRLHGDDYVPLLHVGDVIGLDGHSWVGCITAVLDYRTVRAREYPNDEERRAFDAWMALSEDQRPDIP